MHLHLTNITINWNKDYIKNLIIYINDLLTDRIIIIIATVLAISATIYSLSHGYILAYGDAESHINIAKRVVSAMTPGAAQLGGIWEPLPHIMLLPFVLPDILWKTGLAGSIVFGLCFVISCLFLYKFVYLLTQNKWAAFVGFLVYALNPNILYLQSTPMTEIPLITFIILSCYFFAKYLLSQNNIGALILAAFFAFCASLSRYDGWFLVLFETGAVFIFEFLKKRSPEKAINRAILFGTLAVFGILLWFGWNWLILGDPLYFEHSVYSAKSQQQSWLMRHELPAYKNLWVSFMYYFVDSYTNVGFFTFIIGIVGIATFLWKNREVKYVLLVGVCLTPFFFNILTLYMGQSVIFLPSITPNTFQWTLFNVRYGVLMVPTIAIFFAYLFAKANTSGKTFLAGLLSFQIMLFATGFMPTISLQDGITGLSTAKIPWDAEKFVNTHYHTGLLLEDDFARSLSITRSVVPMQNIIYVGTKPYYTDSLKSPEKYATWIVMQKDDEIWKAIYAHSDTRGRLYKYFEKVYTSDRILIFKRMGRTG